MIHSDGVFFLLKKIVRLREGQWKLQVEWDAVKASVK